jgi:hypothetical protein
VSTAIGDAVVRAERDAAVIRQSRDVPERFGAIFNAYFAEIHAYASRWIGVEHAPTSRPRRFSPLSASGIGTTPGAPSVPPPSTAQVDHWLFVQGADLILYSRVTPQARAAAFRMLAGLPGVKLVGTVHGARRRRP